MSLLRDQNRLEYVNFLIKKRATGNLETFARKNGISRRAMAYFLNQIKELGADIQYDRNAETYYYAREGEMIKCIFLEYGQILRKEQATKIGRIEDLCFSEKAVFKPCEEI